METRFAAIGGKSGNNPASAGSMGRSSRSGLPYLVLRPDAGKDVYWRRLQPDVAPFVIGDIALVWCGDKRALTGAAVIKLSLKTGDDATARLGWAQIHPQVEALVDMAQLWVNTAKTREATSQRVAALAPDAIRTMAGQVKHDILAEHDQTWVDPSFSAPLTGIVASLMHKAGAAANEDTQDAARRFGQDVLAREARRALRRPGSDGLDPRIQDAEIGPVPPSIDIDALRSRRIKTLTPEQMDALYAHEPFTDMPNAIDEILADNGIDVLRDHPDRRKLALPIMRAAASAYDIISQRERGAGIDTPTRPPSMAPAESPVPVINTTPTLMAVRARWIELKRPQQKQRDDHLP